MHTEVFYHCSSVYSLSTQKRSLESVLLDLETANVPWKTCLFRKCLIKKTSKNVKCTESKEPLHEFFKGHSMCMK